MMMVEAFDAGARGKSTYDYGALLRRQQRRRHHGDGRRRPQLARGDHVVDRQRDPRLDVGRRARRWRDRLIADIKALDTTRPIVIGSDKYRSAARRRLAGRPDPRPSSTASASTTTPPRRSTRCTPRYPHLFLFESESSSETSTRGIYQDPERSTPARTTRPASAATSSYDNNLASWTMSGEYGLKKDRDRKCFLGRVPVVGHRLHRRADAVRRVPGEGVVLRRGRHGRLPQGHVLPLPSQWTSEPMVHLLPMNWTDHEPGEDGRGVGVRERRHGRAVPQRQVARRAAVRHQDDRRRRGRTWRRPRRPATTRPSPPARTRAATPARTAARASCTSPGRCRSRPAS